MKREGDGATPVGLFTLCEVLLPAGPRATDRGRLCRSAPLGPGTAGAMTCCDSNYNRKVRLPYAASAETLWRDDHAL